ncbi:MAG TPA: serine hydrolase domain-containing protein [Chthoniobacterales bacterium]|nr:serine hydrolase domain-containing protein [Chthoniobacterales bacterium]
MQLDAEQLRARLEPLFRENFEKFGELGAAVSVWQNGEPVLHLHGGFRDARCEQPWEENTIVLIWSATKGLGSACLLHVLQEHKIDIKRRAEEFWPEFGQAGKEEITLAQLVSHQAGLAALDRKVDILDCPAVLDALERQEPNWPPGSAHGYHARTFGFLLDELVCRVAGVTLAEYWQKTFAEPLGLDLWIGLPEKENSRVATMYAPKTGKTPDAARFYQDVVKAGTFSHNVFSSPHGLNAVSEMNKPKIRGLPIVSFGGIGSANSLAKFYAMLANGGRLADSEFFSAKTLSWMKMTLSDGIDRVFQIPTAFSAGFMKESQQSARKLFAGSTSAFGHPGAGGSHAFADPENKISFAYVMNQMEQSVLPNERSLRLVDAFYELR